MKGNTPQGPKKQWTDIFKKKGFYPALYLSLAAILITGVIVYQQFEKKVAQNIEELNDMSQLRDFVQGAEDDNDAEEVESVVKQPETIQMPIQDQERAEIVTKFFDFDEDATEQTAALKLYNNRYYQSKGIDIADVDGDKFEVVAALSGTVTEVKEDPLYGFVVQMDHGDDITTHYASLDAIQVDVGDEIKQGEMIAYAGTSLYGKDLGTHVYFEMRKAEQAVNPEKYFEQSVAKLTEDAESQPEEDAHSEENTHDEEADVEGEEEMNSEEEVEKTE